MLDYTRQRFPGDPIVKFTGDDLPGLDGVLHPNKQRSKWQVIFNTAVSCSGRVRFTQAHEFGHYLLHRRQREHFACSAGDQMLLSKDEAIIEREADDFAATFLMPSDDFRRQVEGESPTFDLVSHCADRYDVSPVAALINWLPFAPKRALILAVKDDFLLWARSNDAAYKSGVYLPTRKMTIPVPERSILHSKNRRAQAEVHEMAACHWFPREPQGMNLMEASFVVDAYGYTLAFLLLPEAENKWVKLQRSHESSSLENTFARFVRKGQLPVR